MGGYHHAIFELRNSFDLTEKLFTMGNFWQKNYLDRQSFCDHPQKKVKKLKIRNK